jgi:hypothetical protein
MSLPVPARLHPPTGDPRRTRGGVVQFQGNSDMGTALVTAGIFVAPTLALVIWYRHTGRRVEWAPLLWAGFAFAPRVSFRAAGARWDQREGSVRPAMTIGAITIFAATTTSALVSSSPQYVCRVVGIPGHHARPR